MFNINTLRSPAFSVFNTYMNALIFNMNYWFGVAIYINAHVGLYIYIYRERERERVYIRNWLLFRGLIPPKIYSNHLKILKFQFLVSRDERETIGSRGIKRFATRTIRTYISVQVKVLDFTITARILPQRL